MKLTIALMLLAAASGQAQTLGSAVFDWTKLAVTKTPNGERRSIVDRPTATMARFESHVTTLDPGRAPHPPHRHADEEIVILKEGTMEVTINGKAEVAGPGSMLFFGSNDLHGLRNTGTTRATYFVIRIVTAAGTAK